MYTDFIPIKDLRNLKPGEIVLFGESAQLNTDYANCKAKILKKNGHEDFYVKILTGIGTGREIWSAGHYWTHYSPNHNRNKANT